MKAHPIGPDGVPDDHQDVGARGWFRLSAAAAEPQKTDQGQTTHAEILEIALDCETEMLGDVSPEQLEIFLDVMRRMLGNLEA